MQVCTSLQTDNHASTPPLSFLQACLSCRPTSSVKALKAQMDKESKNIMPLVLSIYCMSKDLKSKKKTKSLSSGNLIQVLDNEGKSESDIVIMQQKQPTNLL